MENKNFTPEQSLDLISSMIGTARNKLADDGFYIILWGWLVFSCAVIHYVSILFNIEAGGLVWPILLPLGGFFSWWHGRKEDKNEKVVTYVENYLKYVWISFGVALGIALFFQGYYGIKATNFFLMLLYGLATFISGGLLSFRPLIIGGCFSFGFAIASVFIGEKEQLLCLAAALLASYIIPGHLLQSKYRSQNNV